MPEFPNIWLPQVINYLCFSQNISSCMTRTCTIFLSITDFHATHAQSLKKAIGLFAWIIILNNFFVICTSVLSKLHKITNADNKYVLHLMLSMHPQQVKFFGMRPLCTHMHTEISEEMLFLLWQFGSIWILDITPQSSSLFIHYLLNACFLSLPASHLLFGNTIEHHRNIRNGNQKYSFVEITDLLRRQWIILLFY